MLNKDLFSPRIQKFIFLHSFTDLVYKDFFLAHQMSEEKSLTMVL